MHVYVSTFLAAIVFVFFRAFQQRNVSHNNYVAVIPTSLLMASTEVYLISSIAKEGFSFFIVLSWGSGAGIGCVLAMLLHNKLFNKDSNGRS